MSAQLKNAEPAPVDNKPGSRRRGASGRAAALRRAPSDSDCSGETASLSADSGDRRPPPPPPRSGKTRSRRRGSEWEVLEGLKDGQRFERRPDVFNGFLHKKRKWPLKGWHKRFFVVDGGILVYARSPTDVARGRLHGSLDVGLSVISAKPRRRRIDIDADEFIYHLRAKTPDVFRTWLNVLKAHRLYRQHLLTFGARESVPKIHAPMEDLPPTDTSSRVSQSSLESFSTLTLSQINFNPKESHFKLPSSEIISSVYKSNPQFNLKDWKPKRTEELIPLDSPDFLNKEFYSVKEARSKSCGKLCDMYCVGNKQEQQKKEDVNDNYKTTPTVMDVDEQQMHSMNLDLNTHKSSSLGTRFVTKWKTTVNFEALLNECFTSNNQEHELETTSKKELKSPLRHNIKENVPQWLSFKDQMTMFLFRSNNPNISDMNEPQCTMKRSRKSTNLVKYRNTMNEPCLSKPFARHLILGKNKLDTEINVEDIAVTCDLIKDEITEEKSTQDVMTTSDYDKISEKLLFNLFDTSGNEDSDKWFREESSKRLCVNQLVKELYNLKLTDSKIYPIKLLFKSLLQYYLKNTEGNFIKSVTKDKAVIKQSHTYFTRDKKISSTVINIHKGIQATKGTMYSRFKDIASEIHREEQAQELEKIIKNILYNHTTTKGISRETDIKIIKALYDNDYTLSTTSIHKGSNHTNKFNSVLPPIQDTIKYMRQVKPCYHAYIKTKNPFMAVDSNCPKQEIDLKAFSSSSVATSKYIFGDTESDLWKDLSFYKNEKAFNRRQMFSSDSNEKVSMKINTSKVLKNKLKYIHNIAPDDFTLERPLRRKETPKIIDEIFILRLLENLTLLSKSIPAFHKDIGSLNSKLKKKYEKITKNLSRLNLIRNIYGEESISPKRMLNVETQIDSSGFPKIRRDIEKKTGQTATNTSAILPRVQNGLDKALSAIVFAETATNLGETPQSSHIPDIKLTNDSQDINNEINEISKMDGNNDWFKRLAREYMKNSVIKSVLENQLLPESVTIAYPIKEIPEKLAVPRNFSVTKLVSQISILSLIPTQKCDQNGWENNLSAGMESKAKLESLTDSFVDVQNEMSDDLRTIYRCSREPFNCSGLASPTVRGPVAGFVAGTPGGRLAGWILESGGPLESASRELGQAQLSVQQLQRLLDALELHHDTDVSLEGASPNVKKDRRKFGLRKKKSNTKCASVDLAPPHLDPSGSHMALSTLTAPPSPGGGASSAPNSAASLPIACAAARPQSLPGAEALGTGGPTSLTSLTPDHQLREDFTILAKDLVANLKNVVSTLVVERGRLRAALEAAEPAAGGVVAALRTNLTSALHQNSELRSRLSRIHDASDLADISSVGNNSDQQVTRQFPQSLSYSSSCVSASEFFDAEEHEDLKPKEIITTDEAGVIELDGDSSSEAGSLSSEEGSASSDNSDGATSAVIATDRTPLQNGSEPARAWTRRARLPCPRPTPASPSLWNLLYKNIGKDLSQISMPVTINEPLNMLQRLCEELEYSELLDSAAEGAAPLERLALVAAFAVSAYAASAHRAASKPFNPLLGETYECTRPDRDFRFLAEQVSHHPPISACHAESPRWTFWQEARIKTKFWGKSMEFQPTGRVHVRLAASGDHYSWNKVTTCVHNLFGGQRWVDQYGDMLIVCHGTDLTCKLQFIKASSWSSSRHEVRGVVMVGGSPRMRLQGRWSEGLQGGERPLWRPGAMPPDYELYYGFTRFAMELNELEPGMRDVLPSTDTRLRPDQRALEEGDVDAAEQFKHDLEQAQRERRRDGLEHAARWFRKTVEDGEETWVFTGEYWKAREAGFADTPRLW